MFLDFRGKLNFMNYFFMSTKFCKFCKTLEVIMLWESQECWLVACGRGHWAMACCGEKCRELDVEILRWNIVSSWDKKIVPEFFEWEWNRHCVKQGSRKTAPKRLNNRTQKTQNNSLYIKWYSLGASSALTQIVPYSSSLYTVFHSVIYNSVRQT